MSLSALTSRGVSLEQAHDWIMARLISPEVVFNTAKTYNLNSQDLAQIVSLSIPDVNAALVEQFFTGHGLRGRELAAYEAEAVNDAVLSDAPIHQMIQDKINFEAGRGAEIVLEAARLDLMNDDDGEAALSPSSTLFAERLEAYTSLDLDDETTEIDDKIVHKTGVGIQYPDKEYNDTMLALGEEYSASSTAPLKQIYDDVLGLDGDYTVDISAPFQLDANNDLLVYYPVANQVNVSGFESDDSLYIFDGLVHNLGMSSSNVVNVATSWAMNHSDQLSDTRTDFFIIDDGDTTHVLAEKDANQSFDRSTDASDYTIISLVGVVGSELSYDDGFLTVP